jgi:hypothetical protein
VVLVGGVLALMAGVPGKGEARAPRESPKAFAAGVVLRGKKDIACRVEVRRRECQAGQAKCYVVDV